MSHRPEIDSILKQVEEWPPEERQALAMELLGRTAAAGPLPPPRDTLSRARGLFKTAGVAPTDEEVDRWMDEHRMQKYGQR
jgi:hypothetical protein